MNRILKFYNYVFLLFFMCTTSFIYCADNKPKNLVILLSSFRSGTNLLTCTLNAITRKPIGAFPSQMIHERGMNRLKLDSICPTPVIYRTHYANTLKGVSSDLNKLIFLTRNLKELLFRNYLITSLQDLQSKVVKSFINTYLQRFKMYESWNPDNRYFVFYEDLITQENEELTLGILDFMDEEPTFFYDYIEHKEEYLNTLLDSYINSRNMNGASSKNGPKTLYYSKNKDPRLLKYIDQMLQKKEPLIWEKYLKRFETK